MNLKFKQLLRLKLKNKFKKIKFTRITVFIPILVWTIVISGSAFIAQDAVRRGYTSLENFYIKKVLNPNSQQMVQGVQQSLPTFTGQDVFDVVNNYRKSKDVNELTLDKILCNNLAQRYLDIQAGIKEGIAHKGFDEWYEKYVKPYSNYYVEEDFAFGNTPQDVIKAWEGSPGHRLSILDKTLNLGCSYASEGSAVIILGKKQGGSSNVSSQQTSNSQNSQQPKHDGSRTGRIVDYYSYCDRKNIKIYENELMWLTASNGKSAYSTKSDFDCYERDLNQLKNITANNSNTQQLPDSSDKVLINVDDDGGLTKGQFYCFSDRVNIIADLQNQIRIYQAISDSCMSIEQSKASQCSSQCSTGTTADDIANCVNNCHANVIPTCNDKNTKVGDLRKQLYTEVHQSCP